MFSEKLKMTTTWEKIKIAIDIFVCAVIPLGAVATIIAVSTISIQDKKKALAWCKEEFEFDYHEVAYAHEIGRIYNSLKDRLYKVVLYGETTSATYLYNVEKEIGYNYDNHSN